MLARLAVTLRLARQDEAASARRQLRQLLIRAVADVRCSRPEGKHAKIVMWFALGVMARTVSHLL